MAKQTHAEKQVVGLSITLGVLFGTFVGFMMGQWLVAMALGASVGFLVGVVLTSESKKKRHR
jgi:dipeptide/tripeptide permease